MGQQVIICKLTCKNITSVVGNIQTCIFQQKYKTTSDTRVSTLQKDLRGEGKQIRTSKGRMSQDKWFLPTWVEVCLWSISGDTFTKSSILIISERASQLVPHPNQSRALSFKIKVRGELHRDIPSTILTDFKVTWQEKEFVCCVRKIIGKADQPRKSCGIGKWHGHVLYTPYETLLSPALL